MIFSVIFQVDSYKDESSKIYLPVLIVLTGFIYMVYWLEWTFKVYFRIEFKRLYLLLYCLF